MELVAAAEVGCVAEWEVLGLMGLVVVLEFQEMVVVQHLVVVDAGVARLLLLGEFLVAAVVLVGLLRLVMVGHPAAPQEAPAERIKITLQPQRELTELLGWLVAAEVATAGRMPVGTEAIRLGTLCSRRH